MSSSAFVSQGTKVHVSVFAPWTTFDEIIEVISVGGPSGQANEIDVTDLSSSSKDYKLGLADEGDFTIEINYLPSDSGHASLRAFYASGNLIRFKVVYNTSPTESDFFFAYVKGFSISNAVDGVTKATITLRVSGAVS